MNDIINETNHKNLELSLNLNKIKIFPNEAIEGIITIKRIPEIMNNKTLQNINISFVLNQKIYYRVEEFDFIKNKLDKKMENKSYTIDKQTINYDLKDYDVDNDINIPFQITIPSAKNETSKNLLPSFRFISPKISCFIVHFLIIEVPGESNKTYKTIFIKKIPNEKNNNSNNKDVLDAHIFKEETIKKLVLFNIGKLNYFIKTKKTAKYDEIIPIEIHIDETDLKKRKVKNLIISLLKRLSLKKSEKFYQSKILVKKIELLNENKNKVINESIQLSKEEFPDLPINEIKENVKELLNETEEFEDNESLIKTKMNLNFTPPIETEFFKLEYLIQIIFELDSNLVEEKKIVIPIDFYDGDFKSSDIDSLISNSKNENNNLDENDLNNKNDNNLNEVNLLNDINSDFTIITKEDFINTIDGKIKDNEKKKISNK